MEKRVLALGPDRHGKVAICENDRVVYWGDAKGAPEHRGAEHLACAEGTILPGWVCSHTHLYSGLVPLGMPAPALKPENFVQILERVWWRLDRALDAETLRASARYYVANALLYGSTGVVDHHESPNFIEGSLDVLADACQELGVRGVMCYGATDRNGGVEEGRRGLEECARFIKANERPLVRGMVGLHASFTVSDETVRASGAMCRDLGVPLHVHVAEDAADVADARQRGYQGPAARLIALEAAVPGSLFIHGIHMTPSEVIAAEASGAWFVQNPRSNSGNAVGYPHALQFAQRVALGTDGYPADMPAELAFLREENARYGEDEAVGVHRLLSGWRMLGQIFGTALGPMVPLAGENESLLADLRVEDAQGVQHVVVGGDVKVRNRQLVHGDLQAITAEAKEAAQRLWKEMERY